MNVERLTTLVNFLETNPTVNGPGKFDISVWMSSYRNFINNHPYHKFDPEIEILAKQQKDNESFIEGEDNTIEPIDCKTVGCAIGWATTIPEFKKAGLKLVEDLDIEIVFEEKFGFEAVEKFFDISYKTAVSLFCLNEDYYPGYNYKQIKPEHVAKNIRQLISDGEEIFISIDI